MTGATSCLALPMPLLQLKYVSEGIQIVYHLKDREPKNIGEVSALVGFFFRIL